MSPFSFLLFNAFCHFFLTHWLFQFKSTHGKRDGRKHLRIHPMTCLVNFFSHHLLTLAWFWLCLVELLNFSITNLTFFWCALPPDISDRHSNNNLIWQIPGSPIPRGSTNLTRVYVYHSLYFHLRESFCIDSYPVVLSDWYLSGYDTFGRMVILTISPKFDVLPILQ